MKRQGIRVTLAFVLASLLIMVFFIPAAAAPNARSYISIDEIGNGYIDYHFGWDKLRASYYNISVLQKKEWSEYVFRSPAIPLDGITKSINEMTGTVNGTDGSEIVPGYSYQIEIRLFDNNMREIKHSFASADSLLE